MSDKTKELEERLERLESALCCVATMNIDGGVYKTDCDADVSGLDEWDKFVYCPNCGKLLILKSF